MLSTDHGASFDSPPHSTAEVQLRQASFQTNCAALICCCGPTPGICVSTRQIRKNPYSLSSVILRTCLWCDIAMVCILVPRMVRQLAPTLLSGYAECRSPWFESSSIAGNRQILSDVGVFPLANAHEMCKPMYKRDRDWRCWYRTRDEMLLVFDIF